MSEAREDEQEHRPPTWIVTFAVVGLMLIAGSAILIVGTQGRTTQQNVKSIREVVRSQDILVQRGDCRSDDLSDYLTNLAKLAVQLTQDNPDRNVVHTAAAKMATAADRYAKCSPPKGSR